MIAGTTDTSILTFYHLYSSVVLWTLDTALPLTQAYGGFMSNSTMIDWTQDPEWIMSKINSEQVISSAWLKGVIENPPSPECKAAAEERLRIIHKPIARS